MWTYFKYLFDAHWVNESHLLPRFLSLSRRLDDLRSAFEQFGEIQDIYIPRDQRDRYINFPMLSFIAIIPPHFGNIDDSSCIQSLFFAATYASPFAVAAPRASVLWSSSSARRPRRPSTTPVRTFTAVL
jgi:hypothetical protein